MDEQTFNQAVDQGSVQVLPPVGPPSDAQPSDDTLGPLSNDEYMAVIDSMRRPRKFLSAIPSFTPKTFADSIQWVDDGSYKRPVFYINGVWVEVPQPFWTKHTAFTWNSEAFAKAFASLPA